MTDTPAKPVLLTGASGALGRVLVKALGAQGWRLVLTDIAPFSDTLPAGASAYESGVEPSTMLSNASICAMMRRLSEM